VTREYLKMAGSGQKLNHQQEAGSWQEGSHQYLGVHLKWQVHQVRDVHWEEGVHLKQVRDVDIEMCGKEREKDRKRSDCLVGRTDKATGHTASWSSADFCG